MHDLRFAFRQLSKTPGFTLIATITLALGIGLNTSMFSLMNLLILRPLAYPDKDHLVRVHRTTPLNPRRPFAPPIISSCSARPRTSSTSPRIDNGVTR
jgi:hypothetical protein